MTWAALTAFLFAAVLLTVVWTSRRRDRTGPEQRRRTAEERLKARDERAAVRRLDDPGRCSATEAMARCTLPEGHRGAHSWDDVREVDR